MSNVERVLKGATALIFGAGVLGIVAVAFIKLIMWLWSL